MRVTRESLIRIAKETAQERAYNNPEIIAAYLTGSLLGEEPMLGGTTDIDLVFVHAGHPMHTREIVKLTPDFHLDIGHRAKAEFKSPRELRGDPSLGYEMYDPMLLLEREKFFEFVQAGLRAGFEFHQPALTLQRCRKLLTQARQGWIDLMDIRDEEAGPKEAMQYLRALKHAANAIAELNGAPLAERRFLLEFPPRAEAAERPGFTAGLLGLLGAAGLDPARLGGWLPAWKSAFLAAAEIPKVENCIHAARVNYYEKAMQALLAGENPVAALWPMLQTWTLAAQVLSGDGLNPWKDACGRLGLVGAGFEEHVQGLDHYLDEIEILLDEIAAANGLETSTSI